MSRTITGRIVIAFIFFTLVGAATYFAVLAYRHDQAFIEAWGVRPAEMAVDISRTGETQTTLTHTYGSAHGISFFLSPPPTSSMGDKRGQPCPELQSFRADLVVIDTGGQTAWAENVVCFNSEFPCDSPVSYTPGTDAIQVGHVSTLAPGNYTISFDIHSPVQPSIAGPCVLIARYELCGLERLGTYVHGGIAVIAMILAVPFGCCTIYRSVELMRAMRS